MSSNESISKENLPNFANLLQNCEETSAIECKVKGNIPLWLNGHLIRNGSGQLDMGEDKYKHWFDGHAFLHKFELSDGHVTYTGKFIQSETYKINNQHNRVVIGGLGSPCIPDPCKNFFQKFFAKFISKQPNFSNTNVNVSNLGDAYYAITDIGVAHRFDPTSLETNYFIGLESELGKVWATAHPHYDTNGDYFNVGMDFKQKCYNITRVPASSMTKEDPMQDVAIFSTVEMGADAMHPSYFHSFGLSENYITLHDQAMRTNIYKVIKQLYTWGPRLDYMEYQPNRESLFHVINKKTKQKIPIKFAAKGTSCFHHINSYEEKVGDRNFLVVDLVGSDGPLFSHLYLKLIMENSVNRNDVPSSLPIRFILPLDVDADTPKGTNLVSSLGCQATAVLRDDGSVFLTPELLIKDDCRKQLGFFDIELPTINYEVYNGKKYKFMYSFAGTNIIPDRLIKINVETKEVIQWKEENYYPSEPIFVAKPDSTEEDDGVILATVLSDRLKDPVFLIVLDAKTFKEIARAEVNIKLAYPFHGYFTKENKSC